MHTGSCLCGGIRYRVDAELAPIQVCHCRQCRKAQGTPFATNTPVPAAAFTLLAGEALLRVYESSPGKERVFCGRCGAPVYSRRPSQPEVLRLRAGLLDEPLAVRPALHFHVASQAGWWCIEDELPQYEAEVGGRLRKP